MAVQLCIKEAEKGGQSKSENAKLSIVAVTRRVAMQTVRAPQQSMGLQWCVGTYDIDDDS